MIQTISAIAIHIAAIAPSCTQKTGAPISRSRTLPPPTPVTSAKKAAVTSVWRSRTAISAPDSANTPMPTRSSRRTINALSSSGIAAPSSDVNGLARHRHRGFLDRLAMRRVRVAGVGDILRRRAELHRLRRLRDHRARDAGDAPDAQNAVGFRIGDHLHEAIGFVIGLGAAVRSEERRVGKECVSPFRSGWSPCL